MNSNNTDLHDFQLWQADRATTAAPTYFSPYSGFMQNGRQRILIDGGIICNDPGQVGLQEICKTYSSFDPLHVQGSIRMVSIGAGSYTEPIHPSYLTRMGKLTWAELITPTIMSATSTLTYQGLESTLGSTRFIQLAPALSKNYALNDASPKTIQGLRDEALLYSVNNPQKLMNAGLMVSNHRLLD